MKPAPAQRLKRDVGRRIAALRAEHGWTQETLAERLGTSSRYVQSVEAGRENLTLETLAKFGVVFRVLVSVDLGDGAAAKSARPATRTTKPR